MDKLGDRMKMYEGQEDKRFLPLLPICCRLDGRSFHNFTKGLDRPFDDTFSKIMAKTTEYLVRETNARIGYTQSDEISLIFYSDRIDSQVFFDGRLQKMTSIIASLCALKFNNVIRDDYLSSQWQEKLSLYPIFDCRIWTVPNKVEATNVLLWREQDCTKNSISMAASVYYSDKELYGKNSSEKQEMLHKKGVNWNDYPDFFKRGIYFQRRPIKRKFSTDEIDKLPPNHEARTNPNLEILRHDIIRLNMPIFSTVDNKIEVVFEGKEPKMKGDNNG